MNDDTIPDSTDPSLGEISPVPAEGAPETPESAEVASESVVSEVVNDETPAPEAVASIDAEIAPVSSEEQEATTDAPSEDEGEKPAKKSRTRKTKAKAADEIDDESAPAPAADPAAPAPPAAENKKNWYVIKVTSNREESIKAAIERRVKIEDLGEYFGQIVIPVERITQVKKVVEKKKDTGEKVTKEKRVVKENKKFPGYIFAEVEFNDRILYLFRETSGVGDFVGASQHRAPTPMTEKEINAMLHNIVDPKDKKGSKTVVKLDYEKGDKVRIREGAFANSEGEVKNITEAKDPGDTPKVTVEVTIWGRPVPVDLDYWQVDKI